jgi:protein SCO1
MGARWLVILTGLTAITASCATARTVAPPPQTAPVDHSTWSGNPTKPFRAPSFVLPDQNGRTTGVPTGHGKVVLLTFLYTRCPDACPLIASRLSTALALLAPGARSRVRVLAVSVDPEHDTPTAVAQFIREHRLGPQFHYLVASRNRLRPVWQAYNVLATPRTDQAIDHSAFTTLIDRRGIVRSYFAPTAPATGIAHDVRRALGL